MRGDRLQPPFFFLLLCGHSEHFQFKNLTFKKSAAAANVPLFQATNRVLDQAGRVTPVTKKMGLYMNQNLSKQRQKKACTWEQICRAGYQPTRCKRVISFAVGPLVPQLVSIKTSAQHLVFSRCSSASARPSTVHCHRCEHEPLMCIWDASVPPV